MKSDQAQRASSRLVISCSTQLFPSGSSNLLLLIFSDLSPNVSLLLVLLTFVESQAGRAEYFIAKLAVLDVPFAQLRATVGEYGADESLLHGYPTVSSTFATSVISQLAGIRRRKGAKSWQQPVYIQLGSGSNIDLSVCNGGDREFHCVARLIAIVGRLRTVPQVIGNIRRILGKQYCWPAT
jgi:hypothetical protein